MKSTFAAVTQGRSQQLPTRRLLAGSELVHSKEHERIQDAILCAAFQVHGASKDAYGYVETVLNTGSTLLQITQFCSLRMAM